MMKNCHKKNTFMIKKMSLGMCSFDRKLKFDDKWLDASFIWNPLDYNSAMEDFIIALDDNFLLAHWTLSFYKNFGRITLDASLKR